MLSIFSWLFFFFSFFRLFHLMVQKGKTFTFGTVRSQFSILENELMLLLIHSIDKTHSIAPTIHRTPYIEHWTSTSAEIQNFGFFIIRFDHILFSFVADIRKNQCRLFHLSHFSFSFLVVSLPIQFGIRFDFVYIWIFIFHHRLCIHLVSNL